MRLTEEQIMLQDMAPRFLSETASVAVFRDLQAAGTTFSKSLWSEMAEMGWLGLLLDESSGGFDFGHVGAGIVSHAFGRYLALTPFISSAVIGATALKMSDDFAEKDDILARLLAGKCRVALAIDEGAKHAPNEMALTAQAGESGEQVILNGRKRFVLDGNHADYVLVAAKGERLFWVDVQTDGVTRYETQSIDGRDFAEIVFEDVNVPTSAELKQKCSDAPVLKDVLCAGRLALAHELVGAADALFDMTLDYMKQREQFGKIIGTFQSLQHRIALLYTELSLAKAIALKAAMALDANDPEAPRLVSSAKAKSGEVAKLCANEAIQLHGGIGMTAEYNVGIYLKRIRVSQELLGDEAYHLDQVALLSGY